MQPKVITIVLGGGRGTRLYPLTKLRAKPAVPLGGKYRLIDIPISNAINSGLRDIFVLTQFNSASLNTHINRTYRFDAFSGGAVEVLAAEQTDVNPDWYQGTSDAVRQHLHRFVRDGIDDDILILAGDHLYRMDYGKLVQRHRESGAAITVSCLPLDREGCYGFGVLKANADGLITAFKEKPERDEDIRHLETPPALMTEWEMGDKPYLASMGVYVFKASVMKELLADPKIFDFGKDILPKAIHTHKVAAYLFKGYWEDIGTIKAYFDANLMLTNGDTKFRFYDVVSPIFTRARFLPPSVLTDVYLDDVLVADGSRIHKATIRRSILGLRSIVEAGTTIEESIIIGADRIESEEEIAHAKARGIAPMGIGERCSIRRAIIDKNARIGNGAVIHGHPDRPDEDHGDWVVSDGVIIVAKNAYIPPGTVL